MHSILLFGGLINCCGYATNSFESSPRCFATKRLNIHGLPRVILARVELSLPARQRLHAAGKGDFNTDKTPTPKLVNLCTEETRVPPSCLLVRCHQIKEQLHACHSIRI